MAEEEAGIKITAMLGVAAEQLHKALQSDFIVIICRHDEMLTVGISSAAEDLKEANGIIRSGLEQVLKDLDGVPGDGTVTEVTKAKH